MHKSTPKQQHYKGVENWTETGVTDHKRRGGTSAWTEPGWLLEKVNKSNLLQRIITGSRIYTTYYTKGLRYNPKVIGHTKNQKNVTKSQEKCQSLNDPDVRFLT